MNRLKIFLSLSLLICVQLVNAQSSYQWKTANAGGYTYKYVTNDPIHARFYTLKNGMTVILSPNKKEPRIVTRIPVRAGSNNDPRTNTGLAHYLEHLLFKGTDKFGTMNFAKEKPLLDKIDGLYEQYNSTKDPVKRKEIYKEIDKTSGEASNYSIANEYDKLMKAMGGSNSNAHTSVEETVYEEEIPSNAVDRFMALQAERFRNPIFRIFHTELEAVYEEKNRGLDDDGNKMYEGLFNALFPTNNYGQQTTIGTVEHLKNPSLKEIRKYYYTYYVPNNMAVVLSGDFNPDEMIKKVDNAFSYMKMKPVPEYKPAPEKPITKITTVDINGPSAEKIYIGYRGYAEGSRQSLLLDLISSILYNGKAGLLDLDLNKQQKILNANASYEQMKDYGAFIMTAQPKQGQTLAEAKDLLLAEIEKLKKGDFDEKLIKATVANTKLGLLQSFEKNERRAVTLTDEFIKNKGAGWAKGLANIDAMGKISKKELVDFAKTFFANNYVLVNKHKGVDKSIQKVEKPLITPVKTNAEETSAFAKKLLDATAKPIEPVFLDYKKDITYGKVGIADLLYVPNKENSIFRMSYRFDMGTWNNKLLPIATKYLSFLSTDKYSAEDISKEFYNLACNYNIGSGTDNTIVSVNGLQENFDKAVTLVEHLLANCKANDKALEELKGSILKQRQNAKLNKGAILSGLVSYAQYGKDNPFNYTLTDQEIKDIKASDLIDILHNLSNYTHYFTYYGPKSASEISAELKGLHKLPSAFTAIPAAKQFKYTETTQNNVLFANYDMVQAEIRWFRNTTPFDVKQVPTITLFNDYFGGGMGSIVFQTIRESKALAYSTFAFYVSPDKVDRLGAVLAYVGCQSDKMNDAVKGMNELLNELPYTEKSFQGSKDNTMNAIETERVLNDGIIQSYLTNKKLGIDHDEREDKYAGLKTLKFDDIKNFHQTYVANKPYNYCIVGSDKKISADDLKKYGTVNTLSLEQIFGY